MTSIGEPAAQFELKDVDGGLQSLETPAVVVFTCNHCPYALAWHDRLMDVARDYADVHFYAINPNDAERYPRDSFEAMRERVERDGGWPMPYLHDETQDVASAYGAMGNFGLAERTIFIVDKSGRIAWAKHHGMDDDPSLDELMAELRKLATA